MKKVGVFEKFSILFSIIFFIVKTGTPRPQRSGFLFCYAPPNASQRIKNAMEMIPMVTSMGKIIILTAAK